MANDGCSAISAGPADGLYVRGLATCVGMAGVDTANEAIGTDKVKFSELHFGLPDRYTTFMNNSWLTFNVRSWHMLGVKMLGLTQPSGPTLRSPLT